VLGEEREYSLWQGWHGGKAGRQDCSVLSKGLSNLWGFENKSPRGKGLSNLWGCKGAERLCILVAPTGLLDCSKLSSHEACDPVTEGETQRDRVREGYECGWYGREQKRQTDTLTHGQRQMQGTDGHVQPGKWGSAESSSGKRRDRQTDKTIRSGSKRCIHTGLCRDLAKERSQRQRSHVERAVEVERETEIIVKCRVDQACPQIQPRQ
jgi:hypothetical protein